MHWGPGPHFHGKEGVAGSSPAEGFLPRHRLLLDALIRLLPAERALSGSAMRPQAKSRVIHIPGPAAPWEDRPVPGTVVIVDDHPTFRAVARTLVTDAGYTVVAEAASGQEALEAVRRHRPHYVLLDVQLPDADGFAVAAAIASGDDRPAVIMTSSRAAAEFGSLVADAPVRGFITKERLSAAALAELWR